MEFNEELASMKKTHIPSYSRKLIKLAKSFLTERDKLDLVLEYARELPDKYYTAFVLVNIARELEKAEYLGFEELFSEAAAILENITPEWRKAEILEIVISKMGQTNVNDFDSLFKIFDTIDKPELRTDLARKLLIQIFKTGSNNYNDLLERARSTEERAEFIKFTANEMQRFNYSYLDELEPIIFEIDNEVFRAKLFSYLSYKIPKKDKMAVDKYFELALFETVKIEDEYERFEVFKYLVDKVKKPTKDKLTMITTQASQFENKLLMAKFLGFIGGRIFNLDNILGKEYFEKSIELLKSINDSPEKARVMINLGIGLKRSGLALAEEIFDKVSELARRLPDEERKIIENRLIKAFERTKDIEDDSIVSTQPQSSHLMNKTVDENFPILGLYNTYEKVLANVHFRAIARAAPLCWAYDLDLGLFNFPIENTEPLVKQVVADTSIGKGGYYLNKLFENNRIIINHELKPELVGTTIVTTPKPMDDKIIKLGSISEIEGKKCFLIGVGKTGLPSSILEKADYHLEFTGKGIELETCTAIGILAYILKNHR